MLGLMLELKIGLGVNASRTSALLAASSPAWPAVCACVPRCLAAWLPRCLCACVHTAGVPAVRLRAYSMCLGACVPRCHLPTKAVL